MHLCAPPVPGPPSPPPRPADNSPLDLSLDRSFYAGLERMGSASFKQVRVISQRTLHVPLQLYARGACIHDADT